VVRCSSIRNRGQQLLAVLLNFTHIADYNSYVRTSDFIIIGGGIIGLSLALNLRRHGHSVLVIDRTEPGREASWAAGGIIASCDPRTPLALRELASASATLYPEFVHELQDESQFPIDYRRKGTIAFLEEGETPFGDSVRILDAQTLSELEPLLAFAPNAWLMPEAAVDPRVLLAALIKCCKHREVDIVSGHAVLSVELEDNHVSGVRTENSRYASGAVINCAGAWASQIAPLGFPTRPIKGHMLSLVFPQHEPGSPPVVSHVIHGNGVYIVPRSSGQLVIGSTVEDVGFDKRVDPDIIQSLHQSAANLVPEIGEARIHENWTGLRPGTPDKLPILGESTIPGYFVATGHYRDGIMLAPITAHIMTSILRGSRCAYDLSPFSPERFTP
jgi:glycine oxidase ThiO